MHSDALQPAERDAIQKDVVNASIDAFEIGMLRDLVPVDCPLDHKFTPGLYTRTILMPKGTMVTSKIHKTEHPYIVSKGACVVAILDDVDGPRVETIVAPHVGITKPGTRRVLFMLEDTIWTTCHAISDEEQNDLEAIENRIIERRELPGGETAFELYKKALTAEIEKAKALEEGAS